CLVGWLMSVHDDAADRVAEERADPAAGVAAAAAAVARCAVARCVGRVRRRAARARAAAAGVLAADAETPHPRGPEHVPHPLFARGGVASVLIAAMPEHVLGLREREPPGDVHDAGVRAAALAAPRREAHPGV